MTLAASSLRCAWRRSRPAPASRPDAPRLPTLPGGEPGRGTEQVEAAGQAAGLPLAGRALLAPAGQIGPELALEERLQLGPAGLVVLEEGPQPSQLAVVQQGAAAAPSQAATATPPAVRGFMGWARRGQSMASLSADGLGVAGRASPAEAPSTGGPERLEGPGDGVPISRAWSATIFFNRALSRSSSSSRLISGPFVPP